MSEGRDQEQLEMRKKKSVRLTLSHISSTQGFLRHCEVGQTDDQDSTGV